MFDEIVNALHICTNDEEGCEDCPFYMSRRVDGLSCYDQLKVEAANAIEALKEQLQAKDIDIDGLESVNADLQKKNDNLLEKNNQLTAQMEAEKNIAYQRGRESSIVLEKNRITAEIMHLQKYRFSELDKEIFVSRKFVLDIIQKKGW